ncbi:CHAT domain-containing protein [Methylobacter sp.]|uniref:CHAT domain-containing protein n=1 Tax=Methylobacter sp. TaxID=2051955 RepID=UPI002FDCFD54
MSEIRSNNNIFIIETDMKVSQIIYALSKKRYAYIVLRHPKQEAGSNRFYVCRPAQLLFWIKNPGLFPNIPDDIDRSPLSPLIDELLKNNDSANYNLPLLELIPFHETDSALVVNKKISSWDERFYQGGWNSANFPVLLQGNNPQCVFEPVQVQDNKLSSLKNRLFGYMGIPETRYSYRGIPTADTLDSKSFGYDEQEGLNVGTASSADTDRKSIHQAYPDIKASNEHPVAGDSIDLEVTLGDAPSSTTSGAVILPDEAPEFVFKMRVHLLCADTSEWQDLDYSQANGTIKSAEFTITAPDLTLDANGDYPEREKLLVRANFYYENRWCGEGRRFLDLRLDDSISSLKKIAKPPESGWQKCINIEQGAQPADLLVRIQHRRGNEYFWSFLSPHLEFTGNAGASMEIPDGAEAWVKTLLEPYAGVNLTDVKQANVEGIGEIIYASTPKAFKEVYWKLFNEAKNLSFSFNSILFISDESCVPWELMRIANKGVLPEFLGIRHSVGRWIAEASFRLVQNISVQTFVVTGSGYPNFPPINPLPWVESELDWLIQHYKTQRIALQSKHILDFLETGTAQAVHFACHGQNSNKNSLLNELIMEDYPENITPLAINRAEVQRGLGAQHPIIFLNACQAATAGNQLGLIVGLPAAFLAAGASAVICPLWRISDAHAKEITEQFYRAAFAQPGKTLGEILQTIREQWESEHHLTFLAYVLYGDPQARIDFNPQL